MIINVPCTNGLRAFVCEGLSADFVALGVKGPVGRALKEHDMSALLVSNWQHITILYDTTRGHHANLLQAAQRLNEELHGVDFAFDLLIHGPVALVGHCNFMEHKVAGLRADYCLRYVGVTYSRGLHVKL